MAAPRLRQLRRDSATFSLVMNVIRLNLEDDDRLAAQPHLRELPDEDLLRVRQAAERWMAIAAIYVTQKHRCQLPQAMQLLRELQVELEEIVPAHEVREVALSEVLNFPPELSARQP